MNLSPTLWNKNYSDLLRTYSDNTKNRAFRPHVLLVSMYIHSSPTQHPRHTKSTVSNKQCTSKRPKKIHLTYHIARLDCRTILLHNHIKFSRRRWFFQTHQHIILMSAPQSLPFALRARMTKSAIITNALSLREIATHGDLLHITPPLHIYIWSSDSYSSYHLTNPTFCRIMIELARCST